MRLIILSGQGGWRKRVARLSMVLMAIRFIVRSV